MASISVSEDKPGLFKVSFEENGDQFSGIYSYKDILRFIIRINKKEKLPKTLPDTTTSISDSELCSKLTSWFLKYTRKNKPSLKYLKRELIRVTIKGSFTHTITKISNASVKRTVTRGITIFDDKKQKSRFASSTPGVNTDNEKRKSANLQSLIMRLESGYSEQEEGSIGSAPNSVRRSASYTEDISDGTNVLIDQMYSDKMKRNDSKIITSAMKIIQSLNSSGRITQLFLEDILKYSKASHIYLFTAGLDGKLLLDGSLNRNNNWSILESVPVSSSDIQNKYIGISKSRNSLQTEYYPNVQNDETTIVSCLCVPSVIQGKFMGCLYIIHHKKENAFDHVKIPVLTMLATNLISYLLTNTLKMKFAIQQSNKLPFGNSIKHIVLQDTMYRYNTEWDSCFVVLGDGKLLILGSPFDTNPQITLKLTEINTVKLTSHKTKEKYTFGEHKPQFPKKYANHTLMYIELKNGKVIWLSNPSLETINIWTEEIIQLNKKEARKMSIPFNIRINENEVQKGPIIGQGAAAVVYKGMLNQTPVAIKQLLDLLDFEEEETFFDEMNILQHLHHPNIIRLFGGYINDIGRPCIVFEYADRGCLSTVLYDPLISISQDKKHKFITQIVQALIYIHSFDPPIIHRDLKPGNILIGEDWTIKLADFGLARRSSIEMTHGQGTIKWMAPEILSNAPYTVKADIYSFGLIMWEILTQERFYKEFKFNSEIEIQVVNNNYRPKIPENISPQIANLIEKCWDKDPQRRPTAALILEFISKISPSSLYC